jgi:hypothetical protein
MVDNTTLKTISTDRPKALDILSSNEVWHNCVITPVYPKKYLCGVNCTNPTSSSR